MKKGTKGVRLNAKLTSESIICIKDEVILSSKLGDDLVFMDNKTGDYLGVNKVGYDVWEKLKTPIMIKDLIEYLLTKYNVTEKQCQEDIYRFLNQINKRKILSIDSNL